ncbi:MAG TPA: aspartate aminotransferase family protein [Aestuariivirgaceae bacterium]|jgi:acetylornithine/N-succinyldiaminopimelate aminotransferase
MIAPVLPTYSRAALSFERGEGSYIYSTDGTRFLDFGAGIAVSSLGHAHPHLVEALTSQAAKLWHTSNLYEIPGQERLARRLIEATFADTVFFTNSGAEAVECAIKIARRYHWANARPERYRIVTFEGAFHGRTLATIAAGGQPKYLEGFGPSMPGFDQLPLDDQAALENAVTAETAAILIEPVQGEGGIRPVPSERLRDLRELCDARGLLLIFDEIQCGIGRTGRLFAHEWAGVLPDVMAIAKGIGGGFPLGACLATERAAAAMTVGSHGSTFGGNPLAMAVGNAVLDLVLADGFLDRVRSLALLLSQKLARLKDEHADIIEEVRGRGLMLGLKCRPKNADLISACHEQRFLAIAAGDNVVRLLPPLTVSAPEIDEAIECLDRACRSLKSAKARAAGAVA